MNLSVLWGPRPQKSLPKGEKEHQRGGTKPRLEVWPNDPPLFHPFQGRLSGVGSS